jgi:tetratricopeptide (TPR) repeat protein
VQYDSTEADRERGSQQAGAFVPFTLNPASFPGGTNLLLHNNGDGTFTEVGAKLKVQNPEGRSLGALWHDFDDDGWLDLYVANDISDNVFFHNTGGSFEDISHPALVADYRSAMGLAVGDYNRDGDDDLYVTHWVAQENALYDSLWADFNAPPGARLSPAAAPLNTTGALANSDAPFPLTPALSPGEREKRSPLAKQSEAPGLGEKRNASLPLPGGEGRGEGEQSVRTAEASGSPSSSIANRKSQIASPRYPLRFMDVADMKGLGQMALQFVGWGAEFADFDGDGWLDLIVANGNTLEFDGPFPKKLKPQEPFLLWNQRGEHFYNLAPLCPPLAQQHNSRGLALADYDNDGDLDALLVHLGEGVQLLRNDMQTGHWLKVRLRSLNARGQPLGFGDGAKVIAHIGGVQLRRAVSSVSYLSQSSRTLHFGLGPATRVNQLEVRWRAGATNFFDGLDGDATYEIAEGEAVARRVRSPGFSRPAEGLDVKPTSALGPAKAGTTNEDKARLLDFWNKQRAAMNAMKVEKDNAKAIALFRDALALNSNHEDSRYYLALCLASQRDADGALAQLEELKRLNPQSHRAWQQWGVLRATFAQSAADLVAAEESLERAHALNPEETGALLVLGEVALLRGDLAKADERLAAACHTNPKAVGGFFLRAYLAWKRGDETGAKQLLEQTRAALGKDWQPKGTTAEGDVKQKQHVETTPLTRFWESWDGRADPETTFQPLESRLRQRH